MNDPASNLNQQLAANPSRWLVTGAAGFIGSHLVERLLTNGQSVVGVDNFSNGRRENLRDLKSEISSQDFDRFCFHEADIRDTAKMAPLMSSVDYVLHQAALGSVPRSISNPKATFEANVQGSFELFNLAREAKIKKFIFASSSSVYGDSPHFPQREDTVGEPQSPYAVSKKTVELFARTFARTFDLPVVGLRYFNVFGPRQRPDGAYAAVIPRWIIAMIKGQPTEIFGDGETSRDFCFVENVVQANLLAAMSANSNLAGEIFNITMGGNTTLVNLHELICNEIRSRRGHLADAPIYRAVRAGDIRRSQADISKAATAFNYVPNVSVRDGLVKTVDWYLRQEDATLTSSQNFRLSSVDGAI